MNERKAELINQLSRLPCQPGDAMTVTSGDLEKFAELVRAEERNRPWTQEHWTEYERSIAAAEREACARVCETYNKRQCCNDEDMAVAKECAAYIRARSET